MDSHWIASKITSALAGLLGGFALAVFWLHHELRGKSSFVRGVIVGGVSVAVPLVSTNVVLQQLGLDLNNLDTTMFVSFIEGMGSLVVINWIANFFDKREHSDIKEVVDEIRGGKKHHEE